MSIVALSYLLILVNKGNYLIWICVLISYICRESNNLEMTEQSQTSAIKAHLLKGNSITPIDALKLFGCFRLGARIFDLRDAGMSIETEMITVDRKWVAKYYVK